MTPFVHLHVHSYYSLLDGQASISSLVDKAIADGMRGIALTDHGAMYGIKEFYNYVKKKNASINGTIRDCRRELEEIDHNKSQEQLSEEDRERIAKLNAKLAESKAKLFKPILGCEAYCAKRSRHDKDSSAIDPRNHKRSIDASGWHLILLAKNQQGYQNLIKMVSYAWTEGQYYRPRIDKELLEKYHEGIIVCSACLGGEVPQHILAGEIDRARESIEWFKNIFGDDYYLEVQRHQTSNPLGNQETYLEQKRVERVILELAKELDVKVLATNDVHFCNEEDAEAHDRLICLSTGKDLDDPNRMRYTKEEWLKTQAEMEAIYEDAPELLDNTVEVLDKIEFFDIDHEALMPDFEIPEEFANADEYLRHLCYIGGEKRYAENFTQEVKERIDYELGVIAGMGYPGYFLIVQDFIAAAKKMGVFVGPGRGSAAGSAVAYCLGITDTDPIHYGLLFERFLNPDRTSLPDIDVDFDDDGREEILRWVTEKYGKERVAHIITFGTMAAKNSIKDVARVHRLPLSESNRITKLIPDRIPNVKKVTLDTAIEHVQELKLCKLSSNQNLADTIKYAQMLEGTVRNSGVHPCGIIICKKDISDVVPVSTANVSGAKEDLLVTQYEGSLIEETGLIKMDFLGLKTLSVIKEALLNIKLRHGTELDINTISLNDEKTLALYSEGKTIGTFQFESAGMQKYLRELKPSSFDDLIAMNALYRPGPMDYIPSFIARKHGEEPISYDLPVMEKYLKETYGITVYQEQVMLLSRELAGFTRGESDELRSAMGKKRIEKMAVLKEKYLKGGAANGYEKKMLEKIWADWEKFASYAFNKSHATCYSQLAFQTAYLKAHYPAEYMAGALSRNLNNIKEITKLMDECRSMGISVLVPDVNESHQKFSVNASGDIRFGLSAIKGVGSSAVDQIISEREKHGPYEDIYDFMSRVDLSACNRKTLESLVLSGAFDSFGFERESFFAPPKTGREDSFLIALINYGLVMQEEKNQISNSLFGDEEEAMQLPKPIPSEVERWSDLEKLNKERNLVGIFLSSNPMSQYSVIMEYYCNAKVEALSKLEEYEGQTLVMAGLVTDTFQGLTRKNTPFSRITLEDLYGVGELPLFGKDHVNFGNYCKKDLYLLIKGSVQKREWGDGLTFQIKDIALLPEVADSLINDLAIRLYIDDINHDLTAMLGEHSKNNPGNTMLSIYLSNKNGQIGLNLESRKRKIIVTPELVQLLLEKEIDFTVS